MKTTAKTNDWWRTVVSTYLASLMGFVLLAMQPFITSADDDLCDHYVPSSKPACGSSQPALCCPDDYVCKPAPCVCAVSSCCPDTYCPKPCLALPCPTKCCCPDDYRPKPHPSPCRHFNRAWYKCVQSYLYSWPRGSIDIGKAD